MILPPEFYLQETSTVAQALLGKVLHIKTPAGEQKVHIVETEAYLGITDPAAHSYGDRNTKRIQSMYLEGGHSYVYMIYGMYHCLNVVTQTAGIPEAVLIRAVEPLGLDPKTAKKNLHTNGPGKLCRHYGIDKEWDGIRLWKKNSDLYLSDQGAWEIKEKQIVSGTRIGVDYAGEAAQWPLRYYIRDNKCVSRK